MVVDNEAQLIQLRPIVKDQIRHRLPIQRAIRQHKRRPKLLNNFRNRHAASGRHLMRNYIRIQQGHPVCLQNRSSRTLPAADPASNP